MNNRVSSHHAIGYQPAAALKIQQMLFQDLIEEQGVTGRYLDTLGHLELFTQPLNILGLATLP